MKRYDHEEYGGALLLGVQGVFLKVHGSGGARAVKTPSSPSKPSADSASNAEIEKRLANRDQRRATRDSAGATL